MKTKRKKTGKPEIETVITPLFFSVSLSYLIHGEEEDPEKHFKFETMAFTSPNDISALSSFIQGAQNIATNNAENNQVVKFSPATVGQNNYRDEPDEYAAAMGKVVTIENKVDTKDIWADDEIPEKVDVELDVADQRPRPPYKIQYKQNVSSEDMYLGMSGSTPSSTDCQFIVVLVRFPGCKLCDIELDVTRTVLIAQSANYRLKLALPHEVHEKDGKAKFNSENGELSVTLPIIKRDLF